MSFPSQCDGCPYRQAVYIPADPVHESTRVLAYGEMGGADEARLQRGFVGPSGKVLRKAARRVGLRVWSGWDNDTPIPRGAEEMAMHNAVRCRGMSNTFPGVEAAQECLRRHGAPTTTGSSPTSATVKSAGLPALLCGANSIEALTGLRLNPLTVRGSVLPLLDGGYGIGSIHPAYFVRGYTETGELGKGPGELEPMLAVDVKRALDHCAPQVPRIRISHSGDEIVQAWNESPAQGVAIDIEGSGGVPNIIGFSWQPGVAWVAPWSDRVRDLVRLMFRVAVPILHNGAYDIPELEQAGVTPPPRFIDTLNMGCLYHPSLPLNLQFQVLSWVPGTTAWKSLLSHQHGPDYEDEKIRTFRRMWREILRRLGRNAPTSGDDIYMFYNGLDTAWTFLLAQHLREKLQQQGRYNYYTTLMAPLQMPLLRMGQRGMPVDVQRMAWHRKACQRLQRMATRILREAGQEMLMKRAVEMREKVAILEAEREVERAGGSRKFSRAKELSSLRTKLRAAEDAVIEGFNFDSTPQRIALLYEWYQLPPVRNRKTKGPTTDDDAVESLLKRLTKTDIEGGSAASIKPKRGAPVEVARVLRAMMAGKKWGTWERSFLHPEMR